MCTRSCTERLYDTCAQIKSRIPTLQKIVGIKHLQSCSTLIVTARIIAKSLIVICCKHSARLELFRILKKLSNNYSCNCRQKETIMQRRIESHHGKHFTQFEVVKLSSFRCFCSISLPGLICAKRQSL